MGKEVTCFKQIMLEQICITLIPDLLNGANGDPGGTGHDEMPVFNIRSDFIQDERNNMRLDSQKEDVALMRRFLVAGCEVHAHFLKKINKIKNFF